jgi:hypothetical protein
MNEKIIYVITKTWVNYDGWAISDPELVYATLDKEDANNVYKIPAHHSEDNHYNWSVHEVPLREKESAG